MVILEIIVTVTFVTARHAMGMATVLLIQTMVPVINAIVILDIPVPIVQWVLATATLVTMELARFFDGAAVCTCNTGYHGDQCGYKSCDNPNSCVGNTGTNSCTENSTGFTCDCKTSEGYSGTLCENHVCDRNAYPSARVQCRLYMNSTVLESSTDTIKSVL